MRQKDYVSGLDQGLTSGRGGRDSKAVDALAGLALDMRMIVLRGARCAPSTTSDGRTMKRLLGVSIALCAASALSAVGAASARAGTSASFRRARISISMRSPRPARRLCPRSSRGGVSCSRRSSPPSTAPGVQWLRRPSSRPSARTASIRRSAAPAGRIRIPVSAATTIPVVGGVGGRRVERLHLGGLRVRAVRQFDRSDLFERASPGLAHGRRLHRAAGARDDGGSAGRSRQGAVTRRARPASPCAPIS